MRYLAAVLLLSSFASAGDKYAPLPSQFISAKKVFIVNASDRPNVLDDAYKALKKWGRYQIVEKQSDADLIFVFTAQSTGQVEREIQFGQDKVTATTSPWETTTATVHPATRIPVTEQTGETTLRVFDAHAEDLEHSQAIWRLTVPWSTSGSGKVAVEEVKKRVKEQEKK